MRDIIEAGMEVAMVRDAVAGGVNEEGRWIRRRDDQLALHGERGLDHRRGGQQDEDGGIRGLTQATGSTKSGNRRKSAATGQRRHW